MQECLKTAASQNVAKDKLTYFDVPLATAMGRLGCTQSHLWTEAAEKCSLWTASLFPVFASAAESASFAVQCAMAARGLGPVPQPPLASLERLDMGDILARKDLPRIIQMRAALADDVAAGRKSRYQYNT